jgi:hypothetical protein
VLQLERDLDGLVKSTSGELHNEARDVIAVFLLLLSAVVVYTARRHQIDATLGDDTQSGRHQNEPNAPAATCLFGAFEALPAARTLVAAPRRLPRATAAIGAAPL